MQNHISTQFFDNLLDALYPIRLGVEETDWTANELREELSASIRSSPFHIPAANTKTVEGFFKLLPAIKERLDEDVEAIYNGDPAAKSRTEIILTYPGFYAIAAYRVAHALHILGVELVPRIITEHAHSRTGVDIHPGAKIGRHFFIDHGTGVVVGETTVIGDHVKIYQGVTLGALSVNSRINTKRHPTIGDHVVIYAQATILGGETHIGSNSVIGGNVWLTDSVPSNSRVVYKAHLEQTLYPLNNEKSIA